MKKPAQRLLKRVSDIPFLSLAEFIVRPQSEFKSALVFNTSFIAFDKQSPAIHYSGHASIA
jgi:hypothetical protein